MLNYNLINEDNHTNNTSIVVYFIKQVGIVKILKTEKN